MVLEKYNEKSIINNTNNYSVLMGEEEVKDDRIIKRVPILRKNEVKYKDNILKAREAMLKAKNTNSEI